MTCRDAPRHGAGSIPGHIKGGISCDTGARIPDGISGDVADGIRDDIPGGIPGDIHGGIPDDTHDGIPDGIPGDFLDGIPDAIPDRNHGGIHDDNPCDILLSPIHISAPTRRRRTFSAAFCPSTNLYPPGNFCSRISSF